MSNLDVDPVIKERLLDLYPAQILSDHWSAIKESTKDDRVDAIVSSASDDDLIDFSFQTLSCCKQDIYVLRHGASSSSNLPTMPWPDRKFRPQNTNGDWPTEFYLLEQSYKVVVEDLSNGGGYTDLNIDFLWPVQLTYSKNHLVVKLTKLHKSIKTYVPDRYGYVSKDRKLTENGIVSAVVQSFHNFGGASKLNLHKGIKQLWEDKFCDARRLRFQRPESSEVSTMTADSLFREKYPDRYKIARDQDFYLCIFEVIDEKHALRGVKFKIDPQDGYISFGTFSDNPGDTHEVVDKVIAHC